QVVPSLRGLQTRAIPAGQGRLRQLLHRTKKIGLYFRGVTTLHLPGLMKWWMLIFVLVLLSLMVVNARPAEEIHEDSWGRKGIGETPQCVSTRRLTSRPRKA